MRRTEGIQYQYPKKPTQTITLDKNITLKGSGEVNAKVKGRAFISESVTIDGVDFEYESSNEEDRGVIIISDNDGITVDIKNSALTQKREIKA